MPTVAEASTAARASWLQEGVMPFLKVRFYFWLCWVSVAACGLSLVAVSEGCSLVPVSESCSLVALSECCSLVAVSESCSIVAVLLYSRSE